MSLFPQPFSTPTRRKPSLKVPRSKPSIVQISAPLENARLGTSDKPLSPFVFDRSFSGAVEDLPGRFPTEPPRPKSTRRASSMAALRAPLTSPASVRMIGRDEGGTSPAEGSAVRSQGEELLAGVMPPLAETLNPTRSRFISQPTSLSLGSDSLIGKALDGPMVECARNDRALVDALTATPIRFDFPSASDEFHIRPLSWRATSPEAELSGEPKPTPAKRKRKRDPSGPRSVVPPKSAPAKPVEWLPPEPSYLYEPRFSSGAVLRDVFRAVDNHDSSSFGPPLEGEPGPPFGNLVPAERSAVGDSASQFVYVSPPATPPVQPSRPGFLRRLFSSHSLRGSASTSRANSSLPEPPLPHIPIATPSQSPQRLSNFQQGLSTSVSIYTPVGSSRAPANRLRKRKPAPTSVRESGRSILARGGSLPPPGDQPQRRGTESSKGSRSTQSRSASLASRSADGPCTPFGQGFGVGDDSPVDLPPLPPPQRPDLVHHEQSSRRLSVLRLASASPYSLWDDSQSFRELAAPIDSDSHAGPANPNEPVAPSKVYPQSCGLFTAVELEDRPGSSAPRLSKESSSTRASTEKVSRWLGTVTPLHSQSLPVSRTTSPDPISSMELPPARPENPLAKTPTTATAYSDEIQVQVDQTPNEIKKQRRGKLTSLTTNEAFHLSPAPPRRKRPVASSAESPSPVVRPIPQGRGSLKSFKYIIEPHPEPPRPPPSLTDLPPRINIRRTPTRAFTTPVPSAALSRMNSTAASNLTRGDSLTSFTTSSSADERLFFRRPAAPMVPNEGRETLTRTSSSSSEYSVRSARKGIRRNQSLVRVSSKKREWELRTGGEPGRKSHDELRRRHSVEAI